MKTQIVKLHETELTTAWGPIPEGATLTGYDPVRCEVSWRNSDGSNGRGYISPRFTASAQQLQNLSHV